jgi:hypothetical protein
MDWCEANGVDYIFGLTGTKLLAAKLEEVADAIRVERALEDRDAVRGFAETIDSKAVDPVPQGMASLRRGHRHTPPSRGASSVASPPASRLPAGASTSAMS